MQKVLIPVNESDFSLQILPHIRRFLAPQETMLILLHVEKDPELVEIQRRGMDDIVIYVDQQVASLRAKFANEMLSTRRELENEGYQVITEVIFGKPAEEIEGIINHHDIDLVAMATHGRRGIERVIFGSVAEHVMRHTSTPILLFHPMAEGEPIDEPVLVV